VHISLPFTPHLHDDEQVGRLIFMRAQFTTSQRNNKWWHTRVTLPTIVVIVFLYFEIPEQYWFIRLAGGRIINIWIPSICLFFLFFVRNLLSGNFQFPKRGLEKVILFIFVECSFGVLSLFVFESPWNVIKYSLLNFSPVLLFFCIVYGIRDDREIEKVLKILFAISFALSSYGFVTYFILGIRTAGFAAVNATHLISFSGGPIALDPNQFFDSFSVNPWVERIVRVGIPGFYPVSKLAGILSPLVLVGLFYGLNSGRRMRIYYLSGVVLLLFMVSATLSRAPIIALFVGIVWFMIYARHSATQIIWVVILFGVFISMLLSTQGILDRFVLLLANIEWLEDSKMLDKYIAERGIFLRQDQHVLVAYESLKKFAEAPGFGLFGMGVNNFWSFFGGNRPHSRFLMILLNTGILHLLAYLFFVLFLFLAVRKTYLKRLNIEGIGNNLGHLFVPTMAFLFVKLSYQPAETYYYWILWGLCAAWVRNSYYEQGISSRIKNSIVRTSGRF